MAFDTPPNIGDQRAKALRRKLMAQGRGFMPMPGNGTAAGAEGRGFRGIGNVRGFPRAATTHASQVLAGVLGQLGGSGHTGLYGEVSDGPGQAIGRPNILNRPPVGPPAPPIPVPQIQPPNVIPTPATGAITPAGGSGGPSAPVSPVGAPVDGGGYNAPNAPVSAGIGANLGTPGSYIPLGSGLYYDPATDTVMGSGSGAGRSAQRL